MGRVEAGLRVIVYRLRVEGGVCELCLVMVWLVEVEIGVRIGRCSGMSRAGVGMMLMLMILMVY